MQQQQQGSRYANTNNTFDPNFKFCSFCNGDDARRDNLRFTHWLFDKETQKLTCPFLLNATCPICLENGHTAKACKNQMRLAELQMGAMTVDPSTDQGRYAKYLYENEIDRMNMTRLYLNMDKHCGFCANGKYNDNFFKTHLLSRCPRLACMTCTYCGHKGHTQSKCTHKLNDELWKRSDPEDTRYILDFEEAERLEKMLVD